MSTQTTLRSKLPGLPSVSDVITTLAAGVWMSLFGGGVLFLSFVAYEVSGILGLAMVTAVSAGALLHAFEEWRTPLGTMAAVSPAAGAALVGLSIVEMLPRLFIGGILGGLLGFVLFAELNVRLYHKSADDPTEVTT